MHDAVTIAERLAAGQTAVAFTKGVSMQPLLYEGKTHVVLKPLQGSLKVGDLPIYQRPDGTYVIHRVIRVNAKAETVCTRGDNCITYEEVPRQWVQGVVTEIYRNGKYISVEDRGYRIYVKVRMVSAPIRIGWRKIKRKLAGFKDGKNT